MVMQEVIISIRPQWVNKIFSGEKRFEVRKTAPMIQPPFKLYIYETKQGRGAIVGECDCIDIIESDNVKVVSELGCIEPAAVESYLESSNAILWQLENIKEYKKSLTLEDFDLKKAPQSWCYIKNKRRGQWQI